MAKTAIVTGASSGIGRISAIALSKAGWNVVLTARRDAELKATADECPSSTLVVPGDATSADFVKTLFSSTVEKYGAYLEYLPLPQRVDGIPQVAWICYLMQVQPFCYLGRPKDLRLRAQNAGIPGPQKPIDEIELSDFMQVMNINVVASFLCTHEAFKIFKSQEPQGGE